jgi:hypothetical protein
MPIPVLGFKSKTACKLAIQAEVDPYRKTGQQFFSELVARLFTERHYALAPRGIRPTQFRWGTHPRFGTPDCFYIRIEDARYPNIWWKEASWNKCIDGWTLNNQTLDAELADHYRRFTTPIIQRYRDSRRMTCEFEGCTEPNDLDVHHVEPTFKEIAAQATALLTPEERAQLIATHDWFSNDPWRLPDKCRRYVEQAHKTAKLLLVCKKHHYKLERCMKHPDAA